MVKCIIPSIQQVVLKSSCCFFLLFLTFVTDPKSNNLLVFSPCFNFVPYFVLFYLCTLTFFSGRKLDKKNFVSSVSCPYHLSIICWVRTKSIKWKQKRIHGIVNLSRNQPLISAESIFMNSSIESRPQLILL